jgi:hypothetical protein
MSKVERWIRIAPCDRSLRVRDAALVDGRGSRSSTSAIDFSVDNRCAHQSGPLCDGIVAGDAVVCPLHAWKVNLETPWRARQPKRLRRTYATRVDAG